MVMAEESKQYTVLVVEDELPLQRIVEQKLKAKGFLVKTANSVNQALEILQEADDIDVIWLDHYLYGTEDGLGMIVELKSEGLIGGEFRSLLSQTPLVVIRLVCIFGWAQKNSTQKQTINLRISSLIFKTTYRV